MRAPAQWPPVPMDVTVYHLLRAFKEGLTELAAIQGFQSLLIPAGGIAVSNGVRALMVAREERANGVAS